MEPAPSGAERTARGGGEAGAWGPGRPAVPDAEEYRSLLRAASQVLDRVDRALGQLADGSYGRCSDCGAPLEDDLLSEDPTASRCAEHPADPLE